MSLRADIMDVLNSPHCRLINFQIGAGPIAGADYGTIAKCIENRHIQIVQSAMLPSTKAVYKRSLNCFIVGEDSEPEPDRPRRDARHQRLAQAEHGKRRR